MGTIGGTFRPHLTATRYEYGGGSWAWRRWHRASTADSPEGPTWGAPGFAWLDGGHWHDDNDWPSYGDPDACRSVFILDPDEASLSACTYSYPLITALSDPGETEDYLVTFEVSGACVQAGELTLMACRYTDSPSPEWSWWSGGGWQQQGTYDYVGIDRATALREQVRVGDQVVVVSNQGDRLSEVVYDDTFGIFLSQGDVGTVQPGGEVKRFCLGVDSTEALWLVYTPDDRSIVRRVKSGGDLLAEWDPPSSEPPELLRRKTDGGSWIPVGLSFTNAGEPIIFMVETDGHGGEPRLLALVEDSFVDVSRTMEAIPAAGESTELVWRSSCVNRAQDMAYGGMRGSMSMAVDESGYTFAPRQGGDAVVVHAPGSTTEDENRVWGGFWDHFGYPGGAAVDTERDKVYIADRLVLDGGGGLGKYGAVRIWDQNLRGSDCAWI